MFESSTGEANVIDFYYFPSPNTWKVSIMLEECGIPYNVKRIDILKNEQFEPEFLKISPNNRIPAIVDLDGPEGRLPIFESGAILMYLAEKSGKFLPKTVNARSEVLQWLFWQVGGLGPMAGQAHVFRNAKEPVPFGIERYTKESARLYGVMDRRLSGRDYLGADYSIADIACYGWVWFHNLHGQDLGLFPNVARWFATLTGRDAVQRGRNLGIEFAPPEQQERLRAVEWK
jgi:GST-like protein